MVVYYFAYYWIWIVLLGVVTGLLTQFFIPRKGWGGTLITVLLGVAGSMLGLFVLAYDVDVDRVPGFNAVIRSLLLGAVILLVPYALFKRAAARRSAGESTRGETLSISPGTSSPPTSSVTAQPNQARSEESRRGQIGRPGGSTAVGEIFISYASSDRPTAQALAEALQNEGWSVWWDRTIPPGKRFDDEIEAHLDAAKCVIVLWSGTSVASDWVKTEAAEAARRRILIPVLIAQVTIPLEFRRLQAADLIDWPGSDPDRNPGFQSLVGSIANTLAKPRHQAHSGY
jgi:uncharacterized membrane protein YeaQ/YmgE (transglycosylase-associated protein family)